MQRHLIVFAASLAASACASSATVGSGGSASSTGTAAPPAASAASITRGTLSLVRGADTIASERVTRSASRLQADFGATGTTLFQYDAALTPEATISRMDLITHVPGSAERVASVTFQGDSAILVDGSGATAHTLRTAVPHGVLPYVNPSPSMMEQIVRRARLIGGNQAGPVTVPLLIAGAGGQTASAAVSFITPDSVHVQLAGVALLLRIDAAGDVIGGSVPAQGLVITRAAATP